MKKQGQVLSQSLRCSLLGLLSFVTSTLILTFSATFAHSAEVTLVWDPNTAPDLAGYKIYYKTESSGAPYNGTGVTEGDSPIDVGNQTEFTLHSLTDDVTYFFVATAYDTEGLESDYSEELLYETGNHPPVTDAGNDRGCFIATAAYGSYMEPHVMVLRDFRDRVLLTNNVGRSFVELYYNYSPPVADFIANHDNLRAVVRWSLLPIVGVSWMALHLGPWVTMGAGILMVFVMFMGVGIILRRRRFRRRM